MKKKPKTTRKPKNCPLSLWPMSFEQVVKKVAKGKTPKTKR